MQRLLKALLLLVMSVLIGESALAQNPVIQVSGRLPQTAIRVFTKDNLYQISGDYHVSGILIIEPGTTVEFLPNGRLIDSVGGRIIADGELQATWDRNTAASGSYSDRYCDIDYIRDHVIASGRPEITAPGPNWTEYAPWLLFYYANGLDRCATDPNLKLRQYVRDVQRAPIIFRGRPVNQFSREWGHIVILPGADTAVFRNVQFVNFRKDTAIAKIQDFYSPNAQAGYNNVQIVAGDRLNKMMRSLTTGGGAAMTVFSSKTWILNCRFDSNFARYHGGAVQFLQAPFDRNVSDPGAATFYPVHPSLGAAHDSNSYPAADPETFDTYGSFISTPFGSIPVLTVTNPANSTSNIPPGQGPVQYRQTYDDGRQSINKGRVRRLYFRDNRAVVSSYIEDINGYRDVTTTVPIVNDPFIGGVAKNEAYGGAVYISGRKHDTIYFGRALGDPTDTIVCERNYAVNYQGPVTGNNGAKGGAFYVGDSTSMVFQLARFADNFTATPNVPATDFERRARLSQGGGIYMSKTSPWLTVRDNILFQNNKSGQGGGIYVAAVINPFGNNIPIFDPYLSPNLLGDDVSFIGNRAEYDGGGIYTQRNMRIEGRYLTLVDSVGRLTDHRILLDSNAAGLAGGGIVIDNQTNMLSSNARIINALFSNNSAGDSAMVDDTRLIKLYDPVNNPSSPTNPYSVSTIADRYVLPTSIYGHIIGGGGIYSLNGNTNYYQSDEFLNNWTIGGNGGAISMVTPVVNNRYFLSAGDVAYNFNGNYDIPFNDGPEPQDQREMTRFLLNRAVKGVATLNPNPRDTAIQLQTLLDPDRNGTGLGGAIYINDRQNPGPVPGYQRTDTVVAHRVRMEQNTAWSGAAVYSDNYELKINFTKSLIAGNIAISTEGLATDVIDNYETSPAASRTAGAVLYGEVVGPLPSELYHTDANSIYDNQARFILRAPDAPQGTVGQGQSGVDTLRGNYWGRTEAPVTTLLSTGTRQNTFYIQGEGCTLPLRDITKVNEQGPFESAGVYNYTAVPVGVIPDTLLMEGRVYDLFDKGVDIRSVDYSNRRMAPIEDFSVGIPPRLRTYGANSAYSGKVVRRLTRDPFIVDVDPIYATLQREFIGNHPIGYPLFLESNANYIGDRDTVNDDAYALNNTVFFVINVETSEFIRVTAKQFAEGNSLFRARAEFVPDSINRHPIERRTNEGRAEFSIGELYRLTPQYYREQGFSLETARFMAARYEDSVALDGRRYGGSINPLELGGSSFRYENRVNPPTFVDVYAGERYRALPVLTGDRISVISRTMMWDTNNDLVTVINNARFTGLEFAIDNDNSVMAPFIYGQRDQLEAKQPAELRNTRFLVEDQIYPSDKTGLNESNIFEVTAIDINGFYDPRALYFPNQYTGLRYQWSPLQEFPNSNVTVATSDPTIVRLGSWLKADTVFAGLNQSTRDSAHTWGFVRFYGTPHNPDVVPGGELLEVKVSNYPPGVRTIDSLRGILSADDIAKYIFLYPPYFNCQVYDPVNARYLQQDTVDVGGATTSTYRLRIFVQDTPPVFQGNVAKCQDPVRNFVIAQWTDSLRFDYDVNTDDEVEDNNAANQGWGFPYGRTTYGFVFTDINNPPASGGIGTDDVAEIRPVWLRDQYLYDETSMPDQGATFLQKGNIIARIIDSEVNNLLRNPGQANGVYNLDSVFTVIVNDGHTGLNKLDLNVLVNAAPKLQPTVFGNFVLPNAKEDFEYNRQLLDSSRRILATDLNRGQRVRYFLIYSDDALNDPRYGTGAVNVDKDGNQVVSTAATAFVRRDSCYVEAGLSSAPKTTPSWLKINPVSGILYGTPGLNDAPKSEKVTVVVIDEYGLTDVRQYDLQVEETPHRPRLTGRPPIKCVVAGAAYKDSVCVSDIDFGRLASPDVVTLEAIAKLAGQADLALTVTPSQIQGVLPSDTCVPLQISSTGVPSEYAGKKLRVIVVATDQIGQKDTLAYELAVSEAVDFSMPVLVTNTNTFTGNAFQELIFGIAQNATTGDEPNNLGNLDSNYCEYELPPLPPQDVFDSRWTIVTRNGILRNIFPRNPSAGQGEIAWKATFQPGFLEGGSPNFPVKICWSISDAQNAPKNIHIMDQLSGSASVAAFRVDMKNPRAHGVQTVPGVNVTVNGDTACVEISLTTIGGFKITYDLTSDVDNPVPGVSSLGYNLSANVPNPFVNSTEIGYYAPRRSNVKIEVYNISGELVRTIVNEVVDAGHNSATWDGTDAQGRAVASGTYTYRLTAGSTVLSRTMILVR